MRWIVDTALRLRVVVVAMALVLMVAGTRAARNTPLDVFPEFAPPLVEMQTEAPGLSTSEVEAVWAKASSPLRLSGRRVRRRTSSIQRRRAKVSTQAWNPDASSSTNDPRAPTTETQVSPARSSTIDAGASDDR